MLKSLPQNYSHIGDLIDVLPEQDRTVDYLKSKIKLKNIEEKSNETSNLSSSSVFKAQTNCFNCGKPGHLRKDCRAQNNQSYRGRGRGGYYPRGRCSYNLRSFSQGRGYHYELQSQQRNFNRDQPGNSFQSTVAYNFIVK